VKLVWHYTYEHRIRAILDSGAILPPASVLSANSYGIDDDLHSAFQGSRGFSADARLVLFSERQDWEPASYRAYRNGTTGEVVDLTKREQYAKVGLKIYRIGVNRDVLKPYMRLKQIVRMPKIMSAGIEDLARELGSNPFDWWGSVLPVRSSVWQAVQVLNDEEWRALDETDFAAHTELELANQFGSTVLVSQKKEK
jgi:hypothetical protein